MNSRCIALALLVLALLAAACSADSNVVADQVAEQAPATAVAAEPTTVAAATSVPQPTAVEPVATATEIPQVAPPPVVPTPPATPVPTATAQPEPPAAGPCDAGPLRAPDENRPFYRASMDIDPAAATVTGSVNVFFTLDQDVDAVYFRLWPNGPRPAVGGVNMTIDAVDILVSDRAPQTPAIVMQQPTIARLDLEATVAAGTEIFVDLAYTLIVPTELKSRLSGRADYMRLGSALPILPWVPGSGWALDDATSLFAEAVVSPTADYSVDITVPDGFEVLASGVPTGNVWEVNAARDFAVSVGRFRTVTGVAMAPERVQVTVGVHETIDDDAQAYLDKVVDSLEQFSERWGAYPWPSLTFALTPNLSGGIEFPTHIMQGPNTIGRTTSHEVGHMFFYSLVGNNQATAPWLDEGITSYAEFTYEGVGAGAYEIPSSGVGNATQPMTFWETRPDIYYRSVYSQTGFALQRLGTQLDVDCALARYVADNAFQIATAADFVAAFEPTFPNVVQQLRELGVDLGE